MSTLEQVTVLNKKNVLKPAQFKTVIVVINFGLFQSE